MDERSLAEIIDDAEDEIDAEYEELLDKLDAEYPTISAKGLNLRQICGDPEARTAKAIVLHLVCTGWSVAEIAERLEQKPAVIRKYLAQAMVEAAPLDDIELIRRFEDHKLDVQSKAAWEQFRRSCEDEVTERTTIDDEGKETTQTTRKGQSGNPAYLRALMEIAKHRALLQGLAAPQKVEVNKTEKTLHIQEIIVTNREEALAAKAAGYLE